MKILLSFFLLLPAQVAFAAQSSNGAQEARSGLETAAGAAGLDRSVNIQTYIGYIINGALGILGAIFLVLIILSGFRWMTSAGNSQSIDAAKQTIVNSVIGLVIVLAAYAITSFVLDQVQGTTNSGGGGGQVSG